MLKDDCYTCPIYKYTGKTGCEGTPCEAFERLPSGDCSYDLHAELTACAQWEIDFLREVERKRVNNEN
jgi:hypothetical protein